MGKPDALAAAFSIRPQTSYRYRRNLVTKLVIFETTDGEPIGVNVDNVTYVRPRVDGNGVLIAFPGDDGVGVKGTLEDVISKLDLR